MCSFVVGRRQLGDWRLPAVVAVTLLFLALMFVFVFCVVVVSGGVCVCGGGLQDFLISVLEQKDQLADQLYTLNNAYADVKARLGMAEFEKEKLQAESRAAARKGGHGGSGTAGPSPGGSDHGEAHSALVAERDRLAATLADVCLT